MCYDSVGYTAENKLEVLYPFIKTATPTKKREEMLKEFVEEGKKRVLVAPVRYISKGHNIYPQEIYYITRNYSVVFLYQLLGRAHRHGSPWSEVCVHVHASSDLLRYVRPRIEPLHILLECMTRGFNDPVKAVKYFKKQFNKCPPPGNSNAQKSMNKWIQDNKVSLGRDTWKYILR